MARRLLRDREMVVTTVGGGMRRIVLVVGTFAAVAGLASTDLRPQRRPLAAPPLGSGPALASGPTCDGSLRLQLAMAAIATAP